MEETNFLPLASGCFTRHLDRSFLFHTDEETHSTPTLNNEEDEQKKSEEKYITKHDNRLHVNE